MSFFENYPKLEPVLQERFQVVITRLLGGEIITPGEALRPDPDWRFADLYSDLVDGYLRLGGWRLELDRTLRICRVVHQSGQQRVRLSKLESLVLCMLRLFYHEEMQRAADRLICETTTGALRERLIQAGKPVQQLSKGLLSESVRRLSRLHLLKVERGYAGTDPEIICILPLIEKVLPPDRIHHLADLTREYLLENRSPEGEQGSDNDAPQNDELETIS